MQAVKEYDARMDVKKRVTLRGAKYNNYHVLEYPNGQIVLEPRELVSPFEVSARTLSMMDSAIGNLKKGKASKPVDLSGFLDE